MPNNEKNAEPAVRDAPSAMIASAPGGVSFLDVSADPRMKPGDCILESELGVPIVNKRISVTPIALVGGAACKKPEDFVTIARTLDRAAKEVGVNFIGGLLRMLFPFSMGMLLSRNFKPIKIRGAFWICSIILLGLFSVPYLEGTDPICINGLYESFCIIIVFPILIWLGASGTTTDIKSTKICKFLGDISFPLYIIHYPFMYLFYAWLIDKQLFTLGETWQMVLGVLTLNIIVAYLCLKLYDEPVRKWLSKKFLTKK